MDPHFRSLGWRRCSSLNATRAERLNCGRCWPGQTRVGVPIFCVVALLLFSAASAEIVVDEFDFPGAIRNPAIEGVIGPDINQLDFGQFGVRRVLSSLYIFEETGGHIEADSNLSEASALRVRLVNPPVGPYWAEYGEFNVGYFRLNSEPFLDLSEGGVNDTFFLDFNFIRGPGHLGGIFVNLSTRSFRIDARLLNIPISEDPLTIAVPISQFMTNGFPPPFRLDEIDWFAFRFRSSGHPHTPPFPNYPWDISLNRIRVGRLTPEPSGMGLIAAAVLGALGRRRSQVQRKSMST